ncbi:TetR/AcrR family transcriptional regulator [Longimicrobium sp.]|uniref:TetR/AcrR family transcriptional regulator n=1 Tax=Longimicrobium sp. TaxID=2029185 RepID=UPI002CC43F85|nr:TetR/AcrR family transcriptional regulator [Longimicrobium sp.]HSU12845.1 TetR/AcrR family transcriptional regulator [Longimicrobium sp.]
MTMAQAAPRWRRRPEDRPREILQAALEVFGEQGLAGARIDDIAARAGVGKGTLYHYFPGKDELFRELVRHTVRELTVGVLPPDAPGTAVELLRAFMHGYWARLRTPGFHTLYRLILGELHQFPELTRFYADEIAGTTVDFVARLVERGVAAGELRAVDPHAAGRMLAALFTQNALWAARPEIFPHAAQRPDAEVLAELEEMFFRAVRP